MRLTFGGLLGIGVFLCVQGLGAGEARAADKAKVEGFELLGTVGYGFALGDVERKNGEPRSTNPYGVLVGIDGGYSWRSGVRLGFNAQCGSGEYACSSLTGGGSLGYDILFSSFRLRGLVEGGLWYAYLPGLYIAPAIALIWQHDRFELGLGSKFIVVPSVSPQFMFMSGIRF